VDIAEDIDSQSASTASSNYISLIPNHDVSKALTHSIVHHILPAVTDLSPLVNENTRTVITTVLRKLVPALLRTLLKLKQTTTTSTLKAIRLNRNDDLNEYISDPMSGLACLLSRINLLLSHAPPVPQYIIRMLFDCLLLENGFAYEMIIQLESNQCILKLLELFKIQSFATSNMVNNQGNPAYHPLISLDDLDHLHVTSSITSFSNRFNLTSSHRRRRLASARPSITNASTRDI
jgi:hypothetical protein